MVRRIVLLKQEAQKWTVKEGNLPGFRFLRGVTRNHEMRKKDKLLSVLGRCAVVCVICLAFVVLIKGTYSAYMYKRKCEFFNKLDAIVVLVRNGVLKPDQSGDIVLSLHWTSLTKNGHIYMTHEADEPLALLFPTEVDGDLIAGYVYCQYPLPAKDKWGHQWLTFSNVCGVMVYPLDESEQFRKEHPCWYYAEPFYS